MIRQVSSRQPAQLHDIDPSSKDNPLDILENASIDINIESNFRGALILSPLWPEY